VRFTVGFISVVVVLSAAASGRRSLSHDQAVLPQTATIHRVIDGDTVELAGGQLLRYIGIDTPEVRRRQGERWVTDPEPFGQAATEANRRLVEGRVVRLEYDVQTHDRYGRLLAYVYVGEVMANAELLRLGMAQLLTIPPNVKYAERLRALATEARQAKRGLWAEVLR
jgi:micrococcal nuclease